ncbi:MAG: hypothetical protein IKZ87_04195 [Actinomycetaceae bacterium]|nr:hypothetical protein [Actinomycetaceae bacterium]
MIFKRKSSETSKVSWSLFPSWRDIKNWINVPAHSMGALPVFEYEYTQNGAVYTLIDLRQRLQQNLEKDSIVYQGFLKKARMICNIACLTIPIVCVMIPNYANDRLDVISNAIQLHGKRKFRAMRYKYNKGEGQDPEEIFIRVVGGGNPKFDVLNSKPKSFGTVMMENSRYHSNLKRGIIGQHQDYFYQRHYRDKFFRNMREEAWKEYQKLPRKYYSKKEGGFVLRDKDGFPYKKEDK